MLGPYLKSASSLIVSCRRHDASIRLALDGLECRMVSAGPVEIATRLRGMTPAQRARVALARLREGMIKSDRLLAISLAIAALIDEAPAMVHRTREWRIVAIAKAAHRLASGTHRKWELRDDQGNVVRTTELHAYPRSSGRVLRHLGEMIEKECESAVEHHLSTVLALKIARYGRQPSA